MEFQIYKWYTSSCCLYLASFFLLLWQKINNTNYRQFKKPYNINWCTYHLYQSITPFDCWISYNKTVPSNENLFQTSLHMSYLPSVTFGIFEGELSWSTWWQLDEPRNEGQTLPWRSRQQSVGGPWYEYKNMIYCICILEIMRHLMWQQIACHGKMAVNGKYKDVCPATETAGLILNIKDCLIRYGDFPW